jgi:hypothetical protein
MYANYSGAAAINHAGGSRITLASGRRRDTCAAAAQTSDVARTVARTSDRTEGADS